MNIYGIDIPMNRYRQTSSPAPGIGTGFDDVLNRELTGLRKTSDVSPDSGGTDPMAHILARGDEILTMLETYAADLENPCKTLKQLTPLVDVIEHEMDLFEKVPKPDSPRMRRSWHGSMSCPSPPGSPRPNSIGEILCRQ